MAIPGQRAIPSRPATTTTRIPPAPGLARGICGLPRLPRQGQVREPDDILQEYLCTRARYFVHLVVIAGTRTCLVTYRGTAAGGRAPPPAPWMAHPVPAASPSFM